MILCNYVRTNQDSTNLGVFTPMYLKNSLVCYMTLRRSLRFVLWSHVLYEKGGVLKRY